MGAGAPHKGQPARSVQAVIRARRRQPSPSRNSRSKGGGWGLVEDRYAEVRNACWYVRNGRRGVASHRASVRLLVRAMLRLHKRGVAWWLILCAVAEFLER